jgi:hypothetical protein
VGFTIPNAATATYPDQAAPTSVDFDILTASQASCNVISGCATTATGSSMVLTVASGYVRMGLGVTVTVPGNTVTIGAAHATLGRFDLVVAQSSGTAAVVAGTAASIPVMPTFNPVTQVPLYQVYVPATATTLASGNLVDKRVIVAATPGTEIDTGQRIANFDVQAVGTTQTDVEGLRVNVPPQNGPYRITCTMPIRFVTGTAAIAAQHQVHVTLVDETNSNAVVKNISAGYVQVTAATKTITVPLTIDQRFDANATAKVYKIMAALTAAAVSGWTSTQIAAGDLPTAGEVFSPVQLIAVSL